MSARTSKILTYILAFLLALFVGWSVIVKLEVYYPLAAVVAAMLGMRLIRRYTTEIMVDERLQNINAKAASVSYRVFSMLMAILSLIFISLSNYIPDVYSIIGQTLAYSACAFMLIHFVLYYYYARKY